MESHLFANTTQNTKNQYKTIEVSYLMSIEAGANLNKK